MNIENGMLGDIHVMGASTRMLPCIVPIDLPTDKSIFHPPTHFSHRSLYHYILHTTNQNPWGVYRSRQLTVTYATSGYRCLIPGFLLCLTRTGTIVTQHQQ